MDPFALVHDTGVLTLFGLWVGSAMWLYGDARRRLTPGRGPAALFAAALALPFAVPLLYACLRPKESALDRRERELTRRLLEQLRDEGERCLLCRTPIEPDFLRCPGCGDELRRPCPGCRAPLSLHWSACPLCASDVGQPPVRLVA